MADELNTVVTETSGGIEFGSDKKSNDNVEFELIDENEYEVVLEKLEPKTSNKNGKTTNYLSVMFVIRDDVDQQFKKRKIWYTIFAKENDPAFNFNEINSLIITQEKRSDYKSHFNNLDEIYQYLVGLHLRLKIGVEFNKFKGKDDNNIVENSFTFSQWDIDHPDTGVQGSNLESLDDTEDLPF